MNESSQQSTPKKKTLEDQASDLLYVQLVSHLQVGFTDVNDASAPACYKTPARMNPNQFISTVM